MTEDQESTIKYDKGKIKSLIHENDMARRNNKELEDKLLITQEKMNEYFSKIYAQENEIEKLNLQIDQYHSKEEGLEKEWEHYKANHTRMSDKLNTLEKEFNDLQLRYNKTSDESKERGKEIISLNQNKIAYEERFQEQLEKIK